MRLPLLAMIAGWLMLVAPALGAGKKDHDDCNNGTGDTRIAGCTRIINDRRESVRNRIIAYHNRGIAWRAKGNPDRAIADYNEVIRVDPKFAAGYYNRGNAWSAKGDLNHAIVDYSEAIRLDPKNALAYHNRCAVRANAGRELPLALADCTESLRHRPDAAITLDARGLVYLRLDRLDDSIADYDAALKLDPKKALSLYGRGLARLRKGDTAGGNADIVAAKAIKTDIAEEFAKYGVTAAAR